MTQLSFNFTEDSALLYRVNVYKNNKRLASTNPDSRAVAQNIRRSLVYILERSPLSETVWDEEPRSTGWYGLPKNKPAVYHITVENKKD
jgi:hypothetical protein